MCPPKADRDTGSGASDLLEMCSNMKPVREAGLERRIKKSKSMTLASAWPQRAPEHKLQRKSLSHLEAKELGVHTLEPVTATGYFRDL